MSIVKDPTAAALYPVDYGMVAMGGHCGVLAVAIMAGRPFEEAWDAIKSRSRKRGRWQGGTTHSERVTLLKAWGIPHRTVYHSPMARRGYIKPAGYDDMLPICTLETFAKRYAKPGVTYMLRVSGHIVTLRDGMVIDQGYAGPVSGYFRRRSKVTHSVERLAA